MRLSSIALLASLAACDASHGRSVGQSDFESAPPNSVSGFGGAADGASGGVAAPPSEPPAPSNPGTPRTVEETDLYRLDGNRLYYLNSYRGLMVFDVTDPDHPHMLGRSPIFGDPVDMIVRNGIAVVVIGDWFGRMDDGTPFHGSIVRGLDATDPSHIVPIGEAKLGGWVRDDRVVGDVIYAVSEDFGWSYGWEDGIARDSTWRPAVIVSSVSFANHAITQVDTIRYDGFAGVFHVTPDAIMLASSGTAGGTVNNQSALQYIDISDPAGSIVPRGSIDVDGMINGWGADNGRWNLDFADGKTAHVIGQNYGRNYEGGYTLSTVDFSDPDQPVLRSAMQVAQQGWTAAARFDGNRLYLSPQFGYYDGSGTTPFRVFDLTDPAAPRAAGTITVPGQVWNILPAPSSRIFALGNQYDQSNYGSSVSLHYLDVTDPAAPKLIGTSKFGEGWAWTPAAGTFKAFTMDTTKGLVVLPFAGWDAKSGNYNNGLQLIEFSPTTVTTAGPAHTRGWVERGIFVGNRLVSLSDISLAVVDYSDPMSPSVVNELTLARNVITALPDGDRIAQVSSDWWGNDTTSSQVRVLPVDNAEETGDVGAEVPAVNVDGVNAQVFHAGQLAYLVTNVRSDAPCPNQYEGCYLRSQQIQVVDLSIGAPVLRGKVRLPDDNWYGRGWGWYGFWWYDWWWGDEAVQVGADVLAFRRWQPVYDASGTYLDANSRLYVVDLANADAPRVASTVIQTDVKAWWGNMRVVGDTLYTSHYEWLDNPEAKRASVKYYLDSIDLSDRANPRIGARVNVPGMLVGGDASDPSIIYTIDYRWTDNNAVNDFDVLKIHGSRASLLSSTTIDGWVGQTFVRGKQAYLSAQRWIESPNGSILRSRVDLHALDISNPSRIRDRVVSDSGWGWLLAVEGDRALVTSGWGEQGIDVYQLRDGRAPVFSQTIRTRGWWVNGVARQDQTLFLSSGYWGVQKVDLQ